jgi:transcriptional regulator with GAF, ATPase, and Fis domain
MPEILDLTRDLYALAAAAGEPAALDEVLSQALASLEAIVPYDLAAVLELRDDALAVRAATGRLADDRVRGHAISLRDFPTVRRALESRRPVALLEHDHRGDEGDPYDGLLDLPPGHSCMVVPLFAGDQSLGAMTFDRAVCTPYPAEVIEIAGVYGQVVALALQGARQAALLDRYRRSLEEQNRLLVAERDEGDVARKLSRTRSPAMRRLLRQARQVAATDAPVLVSGETGTGKELLSLAVHAWSDRARGPFLALNCAAIPEGLVESALFGHEEGAFTGASTPRRGYFVAANGGTLLLDEIGDMPLSAQAKLLRVLETNLVEPVGGERAIKVDVRVVAATHRDLTAEVAAGRFREDLYWRLDVFPLRLPPLRERPEDVALIARGILDDIAARRGRGPW